MVRVLADTSILVDIDRQREPTISVLEGLVEEGSDLFISTVTVAEILTGVNLRDDLEAARRRANRVLGQFHWVDVDGAVADVAGRMLAYLHSAGRPIEFQDVLIAASHDVVGGDLLLTNNAKDFARLPSVGEDVHTPEELSSSELPGRGS